MYEERINLYREYFGEKEKVLLKKGQFRVSLFRYQSGVCCVKVSNEKGFFTVLPFQGQQIWRMEFLNHPLVMKSEFEEPVPTSDFHTNYGMFLLHCGLTAMGNPTKDDTHPQHGELPFAVYNEAFLISGSDEEGEYVGVGGTYNHARAFRVNYDFQPVYKLHSGASTIDVEVSFTNKRSEPLEYFYMCHINYRPIDGSRLEYSAKRETIKPHYALSPRLSEEKKLKYKEYFDRISKDPRIPDWVDKENQMYEPEICFTVTYDHDSDNFAHTLQILPDGCSCYVRHDPTVLPVGLRWIARTCGEDAMGMVLPATAEHLGYLYCKAHHFERYLDPEKTITYKIKTGILDPDGTKEIIKKINQIMERDA
ncbi:hypothetical protein SDC9_47807 [bioreactor metagenome]|uniref:DUF4432 domain-containing protein n=1 Tax=bioreactor metagenome TaxID=1076179 RepID=A0A644WDH0_9ZZZZ